MEEIKELSKKIDYKGDVNDAISKFDTNKDGKLNKEEFYNALQ